MGTGIEYVARNEFQKKLIFKVIMPYDPYKAMSGYYSTFFKSIVDGAKAGEPKFSSHVKVKKYIKKMKVNRILWTFGCGVTLDMPNDADSYDYKIVLAQLDVLKMKFNSPHLHK